LLRVDITTATFGFSWSPFEEQESRIMNERKVMSDE
jgi:hypothetical protein